MSLDPLTAAFDIGKSILSRVWPDPKDQAEQLFKLEELRAAGDSEKLNAHVQAMAGQLKINLADANSGNAFQSGWRPAIGWVGAVSLALMYIPKALVITYIWTYQAIVTLNGWDGVSDLILPIFPDLGVSDIIGLIMSMLGVATLRSYDKGKGTDTKTK
tara:strand:- start:487 stop:963 length:477 start_codon:yes stop_codon:yes gene_type:complete